MSGTKLGCGPLGRRVADTISAMRIQQRMTYEELSRKTADGGRRIPPLGLRRICDYSRRIDVDDLAALAEALHTTPAQLIDGSAASTYRKDCLAWLLAEAEFFNPTQEDA